ncbi:MAG TPA: Mpo1-like protein [Candidatus Binatia bacterium]|nr:Mpo1-like protein [Candidatus Binatia bacterium]
MKTVREWLNEYQESHMNPTNKALHWMCIPPIVLTVYGLLRALPVGNELVNAATVGGALALLYYLALSWRLALGLVPVFLGLYVLVQWSYHGLGRWHVPAMVGLFIVAWIGQFIGHNVEGKRPSFFKDMQFLLIGPLWLLADVYRRLDLAIDSRRPATT